MPVLADPPDQPPRSPATLAELGEWLRVVYLRYPDAASGLPECWLWHPDVVEELLWPKGSRSIRGLQAGKDRTGESREASLTPRHQHFRRWEV